MRAAIAGATAAGRAISVAGGRHAMGGQQFGEGHLLVDMRDMNRVLAFDADNGSITVEGGIQWPALLDHLNRTQEGRDRQWGIYQKQTGADRLSIAGALSCNAHGRGLHAGADRAAGRVVRPRRSLTARFAPARGRSNADLFRLAIGGYGLFGIITRVELKLRPRVKVRRVVVLARRRP